MRPGFDPWVGKIPWKRAWYPTSVFLSGKSPWTEETGGLYSRGLQRVGHHCVPKHTSFDPKLLIDHPPQVWKYFLNVNLSFIYSQLYSPTVDTSTYKKNVVQYYMFFSIITGSKMYEITPL